MPLNINQIFDPKMHAAKRLTAELKEGPRLLLLSGGSALDMAAEADMEVLLPNFPNITISVLDERYGTEEGTGNFDAFTHTNFYATAAGSGAKFIDTRVNVGETLYQHADRFEAALRKWKQDHPDGRTVVTMGMGEDAHTAGIMTYTDAPTEFSSLFETDKWAVGYETEGKGEYPARTTVTNTFLRTQVDVAIAYVIGEAKRNAYILLTMGGPIRDAPARIMSEMKDVEFFTDILT